MLIAHRSRLALAGLVTLATLVTSCFSSGIRLINDTTQPLTPYPVVTDPPPPHREADPAGVVAPAASTALDPNGFNPVFYAAQSVSDQGPNGLALSFALVDGDPKEILVRIMRYAVEPGQEGTDPALQPTVLREDIYEVEDEDLDVLLEEKVGDAGGKVWQVSVQPAS